MHQYVSLPSGWYCTSITMSVDHKSFQHTFLANHFSRCMEAKRPRVMVVMMVIDGMGCAFRVLPTTKGMRQIHGALSYAEHALPSDVGSQPLTIANCTHACARTHKHTQCLRETQYSKPNVNEQAGAAQQGPDTHSHSHTHAHVQTHTHTKTGT